MNIGDWIKKWSLITPKKIAIIDNGCRYSYREFNERCNKVANFLLQKGVNKGDRVGIISRNCHQFLEIYFAAAKVGAIFVPLNWRMAEPEIDFIVNDSGVKFLFFEESFSDKIFSLKDNREPIDCFISIGKEKFSGVESYDKIGVLPAGEPKIPNKPKTKDPHIILYTSGTTGTPKGTVLSTKKTFFNALNANIFFKLDTSDIFLVSRPLFHSGGLLINSTPALYRGATVIIKNRFSPEEYLDTIENYHVTIAEPPATFLNFVLRDCNLDQYNLQSLKSFFTGGERVSLSLLQEYHNRGILLCQLFGMTETSTLTWLPKEFAIEKAGSVGKPVFHGEIEILDKEGINISHGKIGEISVRGPILMSGYWKKPELTDQVLKKGKFYTGDLATIDEDGFIYIIDRMKDMYISGGENIYPAEIEKLLLGNSKIFDVAVFGVPDRKWGEVGKASIVAKKGKSMTDLEVRQFLNGKIGKYKMPKYIEFVDNLPRTASGKIKRYLLIEMFKKENVLINT